MTLPALSLGAATLHTRVDAWECDFNGHWNTSYYSRSFQIASEVAAALDGRGGPDAAIARGRHIRFHRELKSGAPVEVRTFQALDPGLAVHFLTSFGQVCATSLEFGLPASGTLPHLPPELAALAQPRGLPHPVREIWKPDPDADVIVELGPVRPGECHGDGTLRFETLAPRLAVASHTHAMAIGYTMAFTDETGIGRMLAELRYTHLAPCPDHAFLRGASRISAINGKSYITDHLIYTHDGTPIALYELCTLGVDMHTRRATHLPDFVAQALERTPA